LSGLRDAHAIVDVLDSRSAFSDVFDCVLHTSFRDRPLENHQTFADFDHDLAGVDVSGLHQLLADVFLDPFIGSLIAFRSAALCAALLVPSGLTPTARLSAPGTAVRLAAFRTVAPV
jgi:hypothetical protein